VLATQPKKAPERQEHGVGRGKPSQPIFQMHGLMPQDPSFRDIESDMLPAIRQQDMLVAIWICCDGEPWLDIPEQQRIRVRLLAGATVTGRMSGSKAALQTTLAWGRGGPGSRQKCSPQQAGVPVSRVAVLALAYQSI
jgi:hypothetical protein